MSILIWALIIVAVIIVIMFISYYNRFVLLSNRIDNSLAQIDVQLKKRADLVPNLVNIVKGYVKHEKVMIEKVTESRKALLSAKDISSKVKAGDKLQGALKTIFALAENYPDLKANTNFLQLQEELSSIEDKIAYSRQYYNDNILSYNNSVEVFPGKLFARIFGKSKKQFLQITTAEKAVPKVQF
ncbi:MAG: LemA family protein [Candidatus Nanoarchaeia archaeon]|nr:LemA family protein [Candidatus Nanoarchaeia archaeon]MDD5587785.1 LemA family protein [Candidatus Nanoarchaeia archaeon]